MLTFTRSDLERAKKYGRTGQSRWRAERLAFIAELLRRGLSQNRIARLLGVNKSQVSRLVSSTGPSPAPDGVTRRDT
jgi:transposase-like protein